MRKLFYPAQVLPIIFTTLLLLLTFQTSAQITVSTTSSSAPGVADGTATINSNVANTRFEYAVDNYNFQASNSFQNLTAGEHIAKLRVVAEDGSCPCKSCIISKSFTINKPLQYFTFPPIPNPLIGCSPTFGYNSFPQTVIIGGEAVRVTITQSVGVAQYNTVYGNGCFAGSGIFFLVNQSSGRLTFSFDKPVSNVQFDLGGMSFERYYIHTNNPSLIAHQELLLYDQCNDPGIYADMDYVQGFDINGLSNHATRINVGGDYYTSITITGGGRQGSSIGNGPGFLIRFCNASVKPSKQDQAINFGSINEKTVGDLPITLSATATSAMPVTFSLTSNHQGIATLNGNTVSVSDAGEVMIIAKQEGNATYNAAPQVIQTFYVYKTTTFYKDNDGDGFGNPDISITDILPPVDYVTDNTDCDDDDATIYPGAEELCDEKDNNCNGEVDEGIEKITYYKDADGDGYGTNSDTKRACSAPEGYVSQGGDCNDENHFMNPGAQELCNRKDDNCNGLIDEGITQKTYYKDDDKDGYGNPSISVSACKQPDGYVIDNTDCDDTNALINPNALDECDGIDNNCDGQIDEGFSNLYYPDADGDGYGANVNGIRGTYCNQPARYVSNNLDCNDNDNTVNPDAPELCDGIDNNCNGQVDEGVTTTFYQDADKDGYGNESVTKQSCTRPDGYVIDNTDCNDNDASIHPGAAELCDGKDNDCNGKIDDGIQLQIIYYRDKDGDGYGNDTDTKTGCIPSVGYVTKGGDCNDDNASVHPGATEICDGLDNNCNGQIDEGVIITTYYKDVDSDGYGGSTSIVTCTPPAGYVAKTGDCNDNDATVYPGAPELCDGKDNNCNGLIDEGGTCTYYLKIDGPYPPNYGPIHKLSSWFNSSGQNPSDFGAGKTFFLPSGEDGSIWEYPIPYFLTSNWTVEGILKTDDYLNPPTILSLNGFTLSVKNAECLLQGSQQSDLIVTGESAISFYGIGFPVSEAPLKRLIINTGTPTETVTLKSPVRIYEELKIQSGELKAAIPGMPADPSPVTLVSSTSNTARVAPVTGIINIPVTVERFIPARRAWRLLSAPVKGSQSINQAWQEGATTLSSRPNPNPGYGTHITGGSEANGFDKNPFGASASILKYQQSTNGWSKLSNTKSTNVNTEPYMLYVRGDRGITLGINAVPPTNTVLRSSGPLKTGDQIFNVNASGFTAIANPYASPINFVTLTRNHVQNNFYLWDPKLGGVNGSGGYVLLSDNGSGGYNITPAAVSPESQYIQSGQGFFVQSTGVAGSITIKESDKIATAATNVFRSSTIAKGLRTTLQVMDKGGETSVIDETFTAYGAIFSDNIDAFDPVKLPNMNENLATVRNDQTLMVERRQSVIGSDTIFLKLWNTEQKQYILQFTPENLNLISVQSAVLLDNYLKTTTAISLSDVTTVNINIDGNVASANPQRFMVVLGAKNFITENTTTIKGTFKLSPNPITGRTLNIQFINQPQGTYTIELTNNAGQKVFKGQLQFAGGSNTMPLNLKSTIAGGVYQLHIINQASHIKTPIKVIVN